MWAPFSYLIAKIDAPASSVASDEDIATRLHGNETVLLVETMSPLDISVRAVLTLTGYTVLRPNGHPGSNYSLQSQAGNIKLLLTDVIMPEMSGPELSKRLTALSPQLRVLFMSGYIDDSLVRQKFKSRELLIFRNLSRPQTSPEK